MENIKDKYQGVNKSMSEGKLNPLHPGEVLLEEYLKPLNISQHQLAKSMRLAPQLVNDIVNQKRSVTAITAMRLAAALNTTPEFWMGLQADYDLEVAQDEFSQIIEKEIMPIIPEMAEAED